MQLFIRLSLPLSSALLYLFIENDPVIANKHQRCKNSTVVVGDRKDRTTSHIVTGYIKPVYHVLVGDTVKAFSTDQFASLPHRNNFLVKERFQDPTLGHTRAKLVLKSCLTEVEEKNSRFVCKNQDLR